MVIGKKVNQRQLVEYELRPWHRCINKHENFLKMRSHSWPNGTFDLHFEGSHSAEVSGTCINGLLNFSVPQKMKSTEKRCELISLPFMSINQVTMRTTTYNKLTNHRLN